MDLRGLIQVNEERKKERKKKKERKNKKKERIISKMLHISPRKPFKMIRRHV